MFIAQFKDGSESRGNDMVWDDVESTEDNHITALHLTLPFKAARSNPDGTFTELPARTIQLANYQKYYYGKEAISAAYAVGPVLDDGASQVNDVAEIIGGIDERSGLVFQIRVDRNGNITTQHFPLAQLEHPEASHRHGKALKK